MNLFSPQPQKVIREAKELVAAYGAGTSLTPEQREARTVGLAGFVRAAWRVVEPETPLIWNWHLEAITSHVQALLEGRLAKRNLLILVPPGFAKSTVVSVCAPAWRWITRPAWRSIFASGNPAVATRDSMKCRNVIESAWYRRTFGITWSLADDANLKQRYNNTATGFRVALSSEARVTGDRADALFIDDPVDADDAYSEIARNGVNNWYDQAFANRLNDLRTGTRVIIMQRLHPEDLAGHVLETEADAWETLIIPQEFETSRRYTTSLGWTDPRTEEGELAFPERFPADVIKTERLRLGESGFAGQHQQRPFAAEGEVFKRGCLQLWPAGADLPKFSSVLVSLDTAFKTKEESDYSVGFALGKFDKGVMLLERVRGRFSYPALKQIAIEWASRWRPSAVLVEDAASGQSLIQDLKENTALPVVAVRPDGDKLTRAHTIVPTWEANRIYAIEGAAWLSEFLEELHAFPKSPHDDQVDAFVQGVRHCFHHTGKTGMLEYYRREAEAMKAREAAGQPS